MYGKYASVHLSAFSYGKLGSEMQYQNYLMSHFSFCIWTVFCLQYFMSMPFIFKGDAPYCIAYLVYIDRWPSGLFIWIAFIVNSQKECDFGAYCYWKVFAGYQVTPSHTEAAYVSDQQSTSKIWTCIIKETLWLLFLFYNIKEAENNVTNTKLLYM